MWILASKEALNLVERMKSIYKFWSFLGKGFLNEKHCEYYKKVSFSHLNLRSIYLTVLVGDNNEIDDNVYLVIIEQFLIFLFNSVQ